MEHYSKTIDGWSDDGDFEFYKFSVNQLKENLKHIVEIGSYKGRSSSYMAFELSNLNKKVKFDCIDTFKLPENQYKQLIPENELFSVFQKNMEPVREFYTVKKMSSVDASKEYEDGVLDMVFIDASHDYEDVKSDILAWYPKVRVGGIISGHDYHSYWPGVIRAVDEILGNINIFPNSSSWYFTKP